MKKIITRAEAIRERKKKYFTGKPCKHGHVAERNTVTSVCTACVNFAVASHRAKIRKQLALPKGEDL